MTRRTGSLAPSLTSLPALRNGPRDQSGPQSSPASGQEGPEGNPMTWTSFGPSAPRAWLSPMSALRLGPVMNVMLLGSWETILIYEVPLRWCPRNSGTSGRLSPATSMTERGRVHSEKWLALAARDGYRNPVRRHMCPDGAPAPPLLKAFDMGRGSGNSFRHGQCAAKEMNCATIRILPSPDLRPPSPHPKADPYP